MAITLNGIVLDEGKTTVRERFEEVGGRDARQVEISGVITGEHSAGDIESRLDAILDAASLEDYSAELSVRAGRRLLVRRVKFSREISRAALVGTFVLTLEARDSFEEACEAQSILWEIAGPGETRAIASGGNVFALPVITVTASGNVATPSFSDGTRTIAYAGALSAGQTLVFDGPARKVALDGEDVTPYATGLFPRIEPARTVLSWAAGAGAVYPVAAVIAFRDRWW